MMSVFEKALQQKSKESSQKKKTTRPSSDTSYQDIAPRPSSFIRREEFEALQQEVKELRELVRSLQPSSSQDLWSVNLLSKVEQQELMDLLQLYDQLKKEKVLAREGAGWRGSQMTGSFKESSNVERMLALLRLESKRKEQTNLSNITKRVNSLRQKGLLPPKGSYNW